MHECVYHVQAKDEFQFLSVDGKFFKIQSIIAILLLLHAKKFCGLISFPSFSLDLLILG